MSKPDDKPTLPELDLVESKREFIETFFKRGAEFTEELMHENEKLRFRVVQLEEERRGAGASAQSPTPTGTGAGALRELVARIEQLEREREALMSRFAGVEKQNRDFYDRYHDIERENNNLANLYVASFQLHSTLDLRELTQIILEILLNFVGAKTFAIQLVDDEHGKLRTLAAEGVERAKVPEGPARRRARRRGHQAGHHYIDGERLRTRADLAHLDRPVIVVPLKIRDKVVGVIIIWDLLAQKTALADVDYELFNLLAAHAASALQGAWLATELKGRVAASVGRGGSGLEPWRLRWWSKILRRCGSSSCSRCAASAGSRCSRPTTASTPCASWPASKLDIILTDINMPIMDGLKLVKRVRTDEALKDIPIIIITTEGAEEDRQRALALGANAYITKPIQAPQVIAKVKELLKLA